MINSAKHIFVLMLIVVVGGTILQQHSPQTEYSASQSDIVTECQQYFHSNIDTSENHNLFFSNASDSNNGETQPRTITSCNSLVNILPGESNFSFDPGEQEINIGFYNTLLSSQIFVFQEPDPPQLG